MKGQSRTPTSLPEKRNLSRERSRPGSDGLHRPEQDGSLTRARSAVSVLNSNPAARPERGSLQIRKQVKEEGSAETRKDGDMRTH